MTVASRLSASIIGFCHFTQSRIGVNKCPRFVRVPYSAALAFRRIQLCLSVESVPENHFHRPPGRPFVYNRIRPRTESRKWHLARWMVISSLRDECCLCFSLQLSAAKAENFGSDGIRTCFTRCIRRHFGRTTKLWARWLIKEIRTSQHVEENQNWPFQIIIIIMTASAIRENGRFHTIFMRIYVRVLGRFVVHG